MLFRARLIWRALNGAAVKGAEPQANLPEVLHRLSAAGACPSRIAKLSSFGVLQGTDAVCARRHKAYYPLCKTDLCT